MDNIHEARVSSFFLFAFSLTSQGVLDVASFLCSIIGTFLMTTHVHMLPMQKKKNQSVKKFKQKISHVHLHNPYVFVKFHQKTILHVVGVKKTKHVP
jgi:hypothetical protein